MRIREGVLLPATIFFFVALVAMAIAKPDEIGLVIVLSFVYALFLIGGAK